MDPNHANTRHFLRVIGEIWAEYVQGHALAECAELNERASRSQAIRKGLFGSPRPVPQPVQE